MGLSAGAQHACALLSDGAVVCWGDNSLGALGAGSATSTVGGAPGEMGDALLPVDLSDRMPDSDPRASSKAGWALSFPTFEHPCNWG